MPNKQDTTILVVDDEQLVRWSLETDLSSEGYEVLSVGTGEDAIKKIIEVDPDIVLLDINLPGINGIEVLEKLAINKNNPIVIMLTAQTDLSSAVEAVRAGAYDYIPKPFDLNDVLLRIEKALKNRGLEREVNLFRSQQKRFSNLENVIAVSPQMQKILQTISTIAQQGHSTVLIRGESGVGKDLLARAIHTLSPRVNEPFVEVNCPSFPPHLLENELFGHERGAYTDARTRKEGLLEVAHKGSVFLNEIGDIDLTVQAKLLQFLEKKVFRRIGSTKERNVDVRVIVATNQNLEKAVQDKIFRQDLFYRLNVIPIYVPPLRERKEDIPVLVEHFLEQFRSEFSKPKLDISQSAMEQLYEYSWPGNVRELKNCLERMVLLSSGSLLDHHALPIEIIDFSANKEISGNRNGSESPLVEQEKRLILDALEKTNWNQSQAARELKISRDTLRYRMKKYNIAIQKLSPDEFY